MDLVKHKHTLAHKHTRTHRSNQRAQTQLENISQHSEVFCSLEGYNPVSTKGRSLCTCFPHNDNYRSVDTHVLMHRNKHTHLYGSLRHRLAAEWAVTFHPISRWCPWWRLWSESLMDRSEWSARSQAVPFHQCEATVSSLTDRNETTVKIDLLSHTQWQEAEPSETLHHEGEEI